MKRDPLLAGLSAKLTATAALIDGRAGDGPVTRLHLFPLRDVTCRDGRKFSLASADAAAQVIATTQAYAGKMARRAPSTDSPSALTGGQLIAFTAAIIEANLEQDVAALALAKALRDRMFYAADDDLQTAKLPNSP